MELAVGDQRDADYVTEATAGVDAVLWVHPDDWSLPDPDADAEATGEGLAAAIRKHRIPRVVLLSSIGAGVRTGAGFIDGLARVERRLDDARDGRGTALLHLRCALLHEQPADGPRRAPGGSATTTRPLDDPVPWVDPRDIATVATLRLLSRRLARPAGAGGPRTGRPDRTEAAAVLSTATGVPIQAVHVSRAEQRAALHDAGMSDVAVEGIVGMGVGKGDGFTPEQPRSVLTTTPGTLAGWAATHLRPALQAASAS